MLQRQLSQALLIAFDCFSELDKKLIIGEPNV
jgi:hypothetical protein